MRRPAHQAGRTRLCHGRPAARVSFGRPTAAAAAAGSAKSTILTPSWRARIAMCSPCLAGATRRCWRRRARVRRRSAGPGQAELAGSARVDAPPAILAVCRMPSLTPAAKKRSRYALTPNAWRDRFVTLTTACASACSLVPPSAPHRLHRRTAERVAFTCRATQILGLARAKRYPLSIKLKVPLF